MNKITFEDNSGAFMGEMDRRIPEVLNALGLKAVSVWQRIITSKKVVDTGRFRNSANYAVKTREKKVQIGSNVKYAPFLELGTSRMKARPTLKPAILNYKEAYQQIIKDMLSS